MFETLIITALFVHLLLLFGYSTSALTTRCFPQYEGGSVCFTQPDPPVALSWSSARQWCKNIGATLPIPDTYNHHAAYGNAVSYFGLHTETLWLSANSTYNLNNYYWTNGTIFTGPIENRNSPGKTHVYILRNGTNTKFVADSPVYSNNYICQDYGSELQCANTGDSFWADGKCYTKHRWLNSWYDSWSSCGQRGLAEIDNLDELARWLEDLKKYWIGLRCTWWTWQDFVTGTSREATENRFGSNMPNSSFAECLASYKDYNLDIKWINLNCATQLQFICQQYVNATTATNETTQTAFTASTLTTTPAIRSTASSPTTSTTTTTSYSLRTASDGETAKSSTKTVKSSMEALKSSTETVKSSMETSKSNTETVKSSMETVEMTHLPEINDGSHYINYDPAFALGFGLEGGLLLAVIAWLALLTIYAFRKMREARYSQISRQRQTVGYPNTTASRSYDNSAYKDATEATEKPGEVWAYTKL